MGSEMCIRDRKMTAHPAIRTHPDTGRKALYVNAGFTKQLKGLPKEESDALLDRLFEESIRPEYVYAHKWKPNDLLIWDNRCVIHCATSYDHKYARHMHRTTIAGDRPFRTNFG